MPYPHGRRAFYIITVNWDKPFMFQADIFSCKKMVLPKTKTSMGPPNEGGSYLHRASKWPLRVMTVIRNVSMILIFRLMKLVLGVWASSWYLFDPSFHTKKNPHWLLSSMKECLQKVVNYSQYLLYILLFPRHERGICISIHRIPIVMAVIYIYILYNIYNFLGFLNRDCSSDTRQICEGTSFSI